MEALAKITADGQVTIPTFVREALGLEEGDHVVFSVEGNRAVVARTPDFLDLAGSVAVPAATQTLDPSPSLFKVV